MASRYQVEVKLVSATNLKNVNWRNGPIHPYAVVWVEPTQKCSTKADKTGDTQPNWDETLVVPISATIGESSLYIDVLHAQSELEAKPIIIGSAKLRLEDVQNDVGIGHYANSNLKLKRPSGRPQGAVDVKVIIKDNGHQMQYASGDAAAYGVPPPVAEMPREFNPSPLPAYVSPYGSGAPPPTSNVSSVYTAPPVYSGAPPTSNVSSVYNAPPVYSGALPTSNVYSSYSAPPSSAAYSGYSAPPPAPYGGAPYGQAGQQSYGYGQRLEAGQSYGYGQSGGQQSYGYGQRLEGHTEEEKKKNKFGMGAGLAMGAVAGGLGALAIGKGVEKLEDEIADRAAEKVEYDMAFDSFDE